MTEDGQIATPIEVGHLYTNGFQLNLSNADVNSIFMLNGVPQISLSMSFTTAKTLAVALNEMIEALECVTGRSIMTTSEVGCGMRLLAEKANANDA